MIENILFSFGDAREIDERFMNATTGIGGSGPAFVFMFVEALYKAALKYGIPCNVALEMAVYTIRGSANLIEAAYDRGDESIREGADLSKLVEAVCSKGGTTIEGVKYLNENRFEDITIEAIKRTIARAEEMSKTNEER